MTVAVQASILLLLLVPLLGVAGVDFDVLSKSSFSISSSQYCSLPPFGDVESTRKDKIELKKLKEIYSREQLRARINTQATYAKLNMEYTYDKKLGKGLSFDVHSQACTRFSLEDLSQDLCRYDRVIKSLEKISIKPLGKNFDHVVGPARIMLLVATLNPSSFELLGAKNTITVRFIPVKAFKLIFESGDIEMTLYYDTLASQNLKEPPLNSKIPMQISFFLKESDHWSFMYFNYYQYKPLVESFITLDLAKHRALDLFKSGVVHDDLAYPTGYQCSLFLRDQDPKSSTGQFIKTQDMFADYDRDTLQFSFYAKVNDKIINKSGRTYVAYDGNLQMLRIDTKRLALRTVHKRKDSTKIYDLTRNRKYTITSLDANDKRKLAHVKMDSDRPIDEFGCSVSLIRNPIVSLEPFDLVKFLFGEEEFVYMGRARVHGINALVYEARGHRLPEWFSQPLLVKSSDKKTYISRELGEPLDDSSPEQKKRSLSIQVYVTAGSEGQIRPLLLDVIDMSFSFKSSYRDILKVEFDYFFMDLNHAPDGTPEDQLFELADSCSSYLNSEKFIQIEAVIEMNEGKDLDLHQIWSSRKDHRSQLALKAALRDAFRIEGVMMSDFQSKAISSTLLMVNFRIAEHPAQLHTIEFIGNAKLNDYFGKLIRVRGEAPDDCFWALGEAGAQTARMLFSPTAKTCVFETDALASKTVEVAKSDYFSLDSKSKDELYLLSVQKDNQLHLEAFAREAQFLTHEKVHLNSWLNSGSKKISNEDINKAIFQVKKIHLKEENHLLAPFDDTGSQERTAIKFPGFILTAVGNMQPLRENDQEVPVTPEECRAFCLEQVKCRWYSFCKVGGNSCILSDIAAPVKEVGKYLREYQRDTSTVRLSKPRFVYGDIVLALDTNPLCELRAKVELDFFKEYSSTWTILDHYRVVPNEQGGIENCAKLCLNTNVELLQDHFSNRNESVNPSQFCSNFGFIQATFDASQVIYLKKEFEGDLKTAGSYCLFDRSLTIASEILVHKHESSPKFNARVFKFDFSKLFHKRLAYGLLKSELSLEEILAWDAIKSNKQADVEPFLVTLDEAYESGKNLQQFTAVDALQCAANCFLQQVTLSPACRSFDIHEDMCVLNTQKMDNSALGKLVTFDNKRTGADQDVHYEFAVSFVEDISLSMSQRYRKKSARPQVRSDVEATSSSAIIGKLSVVIVGIVTGLYLSSMLTRLVSGKQHVDGDFRTGLVDLSRLDQ